MSIRNLIHVDNFPDKLGQPYSSVNIDGGFKVTSYPGSATVISVQGDYYGFQCSQVPTLQGSDFTLHNGTTDPYIIYEGDVDTMAEIDFSCGLTASSSKSIASIKLFLTEPGGHETGLAGSQQYVTADVSDIRFVSSSIKHRITPGLKIRFHIANESSTDNLAVHCPTIRVHS